VYRPRGAVAGPARSPATDLTDADALVQPEVAAPFVRGVGYALPLALQEHPANAPRRWLAR
jgi:hypothetical protein